MDILRGYAEESTVTRQVFQMLQISMNAHVYPDLYVPRPYKTVPSTFRTLPTLLQQRYRI